MSAIKNAPAGEVSFRGRAEKRLAEKTGFSDVETDPDVLLHELQVHQLELEMQNEELQHAQDELEKSHAKYFDLYELAPVGYFTLGLDGTIQETNLTAAHLLGVEKSRLQHQRLSRFVTADSQDVLYFHLRNILKSGVQETCDVKIQKSNQDSFFANLVSMPIRDDSQTITQIRTTVTDINEKRILQMKFRERAEKNEVLLNLLPHPAMLIDKERKILAANQLALKNGARVGCVIDPPDALGNEKGTRTSNPEIEQTFGLQKVQGIFCLPDDEPNQRWLVSVIENSNDAICVLDLHGNIDAWNRQAEKTYGYTAQEAMKLTVFDLAPSGSKKGLRTLLKDSVSGVLVPPFESRRIAKDGCLVDVLVTVTRLVKNDVIFGVALTERDISDHNRRLEEMKKFPQRIILAQEKERNRVSQEIHSDLGQSLLALKMFIISSAPELPQSTPASKAIFEEVKKRLNGIIKTARDLSHKLAPTGIKSIGLVQSLRNLVESINFPRGLNVRFTQHNMERMPPHSRDIIIFRIVQEALNNVFKHSNASRVEVEALFNNSTITLTIHDDGGGFDQATKRPSKGLGLDLMREQAALIHGSLGIQSKAGAGTTIRFSVPVKTQKGHASDERICHRPG